MAVDALLEAGASLDTAMAPDGSTPLIVATDKGHAMVVEKLLRAGANPNIANTDGTFRVNVVCTHVEQFTQHLKGLHPHLFVLSLSLLA